MGKNKKNNEDKLKKYLEKNKDKISVYFQQHIATIGAIPAETQTTK